MEKILNVKNKSGLHARPSGMLAKTASKYKSSISIECNGKTANAKSVMHLMSLCIKENNEVKIIVNGEDEVNAFNEIVDLFESGFGEI